MTVNFRSIFKQHKGFFLFIALMVVFRSSFADWNHVPTGSMKPTILEGDHIVVNKLAYDFRLPIIRTSLLNIADPKRGDVVIFESKVSQQRLVKRVIGIPNDEVRMSNNQLIVNGEALNYTLNQVQRGLHDFTENLFGHEHTIRINAERSASSASNFGLVKIPKDMYLVLGDNRNNSADSRFIGLVPRDEILGRSSTVAFSLNYENFYLPRRERFIKAL